MVSKQKDACSFFLNVEYVFHFAVYERKGGGVGNMLVTCVRVTIGTTDSDVVHQRETITRLITVLVYGLAVLLYVFDCGGFLQLERMTRAFH